MSIQAGVTAPAETAKLGFDLCDLDLWPDLDITFVIGNNFWKFYDDTMMGT